MLLRGAFAISLLALLGGCAFDAAPAEQTQAAEQSIEHAAPAWTAGTFGFTSLDIGQGDAAVVFAPHGCVALLDAGPTGSGRTIKQYLRGLGITKIDFAVVSHYHEDHFGGLDEVEQGDDALRISTVYDHGGSYSSAAYRQYETQFRDRRVAVDAGRRISLCNEVDFKVVASDANGVSTSDENARSVTVKVSYGELDVLVGGDLTSSGTDVEAAIAEDVGPVEVYKVHHHGSKGSSSARFLAGIQPTVSFISVAANNSYGHPHPSTVLRLQDAGTAIWETRGTAGGPRGHLGLTSVRGSSFTVAQRDRSATYSAH